MKFKYHTIKTVALLSMVVLLVIACDDQGDLKLVNEGVYISDNLYESINSDDFQISEVFYHQDNLQITITSSGCDGQSWTGVLIAQEIVAESSPPQRNIRFVLENEELCDAVINKTFSFDISSLQVEGESIILHLDSWSTLIDYKY